MNAKSKLELAANILRVGGRLEDQNPDMARGRPGYTAAVEEIWRDATRLATLVRSEGAADYARALLLWAEGSVRDENDLQAIVAAIRAAAPVEPTPPVAGPDAAPPELAAPPNLSPRAAEAHRVILEVLRKHEATYTGGCRGFYSNAQWAERGEEYGRGAVLVVVYDGGDLGDFFNLDHAESDSSRYEAMRKALEEIGLYSEECTGWYSGIYEIDFDRSASAGLAVMTTAREEFTSTETRQLAALTLKRFGWDNAAAAAAWRRMLGNSCTDEQFAQIAAPEAGAVRRGLR